MFDHFVMGMATTTPLSPPPPSPHTTVPSTLAPPPPIPAVYTPTDSLATALASESLSHLDDISPSALPHDDDGEHMYLSVDDESESDVELAPTHPKIHHHPSTSTHHHRRRQHPLSKQLLSDAGPHPTALEALVEEMVATGTQCTVSAAPLPSAASLAEDEDELESDPQLPTELASLAETGLEIPPTTTAATTAPSLSWQISTATIPPNPILADPHPTPLPDLELSLFDPAASDDEGFHELPGAVHPLGTMDAHPPVLGTGADDGYALGTRRWSHLRLRRLLMEGGMGAEMAEMGREMLGSVGEGGVVRPRVRKAICRRRTGGRERGRRRRGAVGGAGVLTEVGGFEG